MNVGEVGIEGWNEFEEYAFVYAKKGSKKILVKCLAIDDKLLVDAIAEGGKEEPAHLEIEYVYSFICVGSILMVLKVCFFFLAELGTMLLSRERKETTMQSLRIWGS